MEVLKQIQILRKEVGRGIYSIRPDSHRIVQELDKIEKIYTKNLGERANDLKLIEKVKKQLEGKETTIKNLITELEEKDNLIKELETDKDPLSKKLNTLQNSEKQLLQIFKEYKDEIMLFETFQANIRREQAMFLSSTVKEVRKSLEESEIDKACQDAWIKELVDNYNSSLKLSSKLIDDSIMNLIVNIKEEIDNTINQINK
jgi:chromosome segregation ATPase